MKNSKKIGAEIKRLREAKELSREDLADKLGASPSAIAMYELGERIPRDEMKVKIADFFGVSLESLFFAS